MSELGDDLIQGLKEAVTYKRGELNAGDVKAYQYPTIPENIDVKSIHSNMGLTQE